MGEGGSGPKRYKMLLISPMGEGGSNGLCYIKVCNKNGREATEISRIFLYFRDFFSKFCDFLPKFSHFFSKFFQNFADFFLLSLTKSTFFIDFVKVDDDFICEAEEIMWIL